MTDTTNKPNIPTSPTIKELAHKARELYAKLRNELEPANNGKYIVIEVDSEKYFIGDTKDEAMAKARKEFPGIVLFVRRIGELEKVSHHSSSFSAKKYARLF